jgi:hypothetical protein
MTATPQSVDVAILREWRGEGGEIAFVDVREEGPHGEGHPLPWPRLPAWRIGARMQAYLRWETELPEQIAADGLAGFNLGPH